MPVSSRAWRGAATSASRTGLTARADRDEAPAERPAGATRASSASVFHAPQPGHWPCHLAASVPQAEQTNTLEGLAMVHGH
jgi:hypothetical protein